MEKIKQALDKARQERQQSGDQAHIGHDDGVMDGEPFYQC